MIYKGKHGSFASINSHGEYKGFHDCRLILSTTRWYPQGQLGTEDPNMETKKYTLRLCLGVHNEPDVNR